MSNSGFHFINYTALEEKIFHGIKKYFEKLPPVGSDDYQNAFVDLIRQHGAGGQHYILSQELFDDLIESETGTQFEQLSIDEKLEVMKFYESNFMDSFYNSKNDTYEYCTDDLIVEIVERFKAWMDDNFDVEELHEQEGMGEEIENFNFEFPQTAQSFLYELCELIDDPQINECKYAFMNGRIEVDEELTITINTDHIYKYIEYDFSFQLIATREEISLWCSGFNMNDKELKCIFYQYHIDNGEVINGDISMMQNWLEQNFINSGLRESLNVSINVNGESVY